MSIEWVPSTHPDWGLMLTCRTQDGWAKVGEEGEDLNRRPHWRSIENFSIIADGLDKDGMMTPFVTHRLARSAFTSGGYETLARQASALYASSQGEAGMAPVARTPGEILAEVGTSAGSASDNAPLSHLTWWEADILCRALGGGLAGEAEADLVFSNHGFSLEDSGDMVWTATPWNDWSYNLCAFDPERKRWYAPADRVLPDDASNKTSRAAFIHYGSTERLRAPIDGKSSRGRALIIFADEYPGKADHAPPP